MGDPLGPVRGWRAFARHQDGRRCVDRGEASTGVDRHRAARLLALFVEEREATFAASISHGAISAKFAAAAAAKRAARAQLWRRTHDQDAAVEEVLATVADLFDLLSAMDPERRPVQYWLAQVGAREPGAPCDVDQSGMQGVPAAAVVIPPTEGTGR